MLHFSNPFISSLTQISNNPERLIYYNNNLKWELCRQVSTKSNQYLHKLQAEADVTGAGLVLFNHDGWLLGDRIFNLFLAALLLS